MTKSQRVHSPYEILDVHRRSTDVEIRDAYYRLARRWHPDRRRGDKDEFIRISEAADAIRTVEARAKRVELLVFKHPPCPKCNASGVTWGGKGFTNKRAARCVTCAGEGFLTDQRK